MSAAAARLPRACRRGTLMFMGCVSWVGRMMAHPGRAGLRRAPGCITSSPRFRGRRAQGGVILAKDPIILLGVGLMALVARRDSVLGHLRLERILVAEAEVGPVAGLVLEAL